MITIAIPGPPVPWRRAGSNGKRKYNLPKHFGKKLDIAKLAKSEMQHAGLELFQGGLVMRVKFVREPEKSWPKKKKTAALLGAVLPSTRPDLSNYIKLVEDALSGIVYRDDAQIIRISAEKVYGPQALTVVTVKEIEGE